MKKDKEWLKEALDKSITGFNGRGLSRYEMGRLDGYTHATVLIDQLDEPEKAVIPQFVAGYYERYKDCGLTFEEWFGFPLPKDLEDDPQAADVFKWLLDNEHDTDLERQFILADIIAHGLDGYEVEKEILWEIPMPDLKTSDGHIQYLTYDPKARTYFASRKNGRLKQTFNAKDLASVPGQYRRYAELC